MPSEIFQSAYKTAVSVTDVGRKRENNEDAVLVLDNFGCYAVSDGMGGGAAGEIASSTVVTYIRRAITESAMLPESRRERFSEAVYAAHRDICAYAQKRGYDSMGATLAAVLLNPWDPTTADLYHAGDSRIYRLRGRRLEQLTTDHTVGNASGLSEAQMPTGMSGLLSNVVGMANGFFLTNAPLEIKVGDILLICSDGLYRQIPAERIVSSLQKAPDLKEVLASWVAEANAQEGIDNLSAVLIRFDSIPEKYIPTDEEVERNSRPDPAAASVGAAVGDTVI